MKYLYQKFHGTQVIRRGNWNVIWTRRATVKVLKMYRLVDDPFEQAKVTEPYPDQCDELKALMHRAHSPSRCFRSDRMNDGSIEARSRVIG